MSTRDYVVVLTVREHFTMMVSAESAKEAREKALSAEGNQPVTQDGDREIIGVRVYRDA